MIKFQKRYFVGKLEINETNSYHKHNAHLYSSRFQKRLYDESAIFRVEVLTQILYKCNEDRPYYAKQIQDIFVHYQEGFSFVTGKASAEFKDVHTTIPNGAPSITPYTTANIRSGHAIPQESPVYRKSEKYKLFRKKNGLVLSTKCTD